MSINLSNKSIAVVHEHYYERGGAEYVAEEIARTFDAPIFTGFINEEALPPEPERDELEFHELFGDRRLTPVVKQFSWFRNFYYQFSWQRLPELVDYDVIIQSGNNPGWYVPPEEQIVVKYVHTTPRTPYDLFHQHADDFATKLYAYASRVLYYPNVPYPDMYIANSELVARRLERYWGIREAEVIYPPTNVESYKTTDKKEFYLSLSRLTEDKRVNEIINAFSNHPDKHLIIGGVGPREEDLKLLAEDINNVEFRGYLDETEKRELLGSAKALVYAAVNEDFGMVPIEAYASGTPVIGIRDGYTKYQVRDGVTGILYDRGVQSLVDAVERFDSEGVDADASDLIGVAEKYSLEHFRESMCDKVKSTIEDAQINASPDI